MQIKLLRTDYQVGHAPELHMSELLEAERDFERKNNFNRLINTIIIILFNRFLALFSK